MSNESELGLKVQVYGAAIHPVPKYVARFTSELVKVLGMEEAHDPKTYRYPTSGGAGGDGVTHIQPITDSFIVVDTWNLHSGAYLHVCSCKPFSVAKLIAWLQEGGYRIVKGVTYSLAFEGVE